MTQFAFGAVSGLAIGLFVGAVIATRCLSKSVARLVGSMEQFLCLDIAKRRLAERSLEELQRKFNSTTKMETTAKGDGK